MLYSNDMKKLLDIQDKNITIEENAIEIKQFKGKMSKFITAKLTYTPTHCECCGIKNEDYTVYKNGTKTSRITLPISGVYPTYLNLKKNAFSVNHVDVRLVQKHQSFKSTALFKYK